VAEALCKYRGLAPWVAAGLMFVTNLVALGYWSGSIQTHQNELDRRIALLESSDRVQGQQISASSARLARIEEGVAYIRDAVRSERGR